MTSYESVLQYHCKQSTIGMPSQIRVPKARKLFLMYLLLGLIPILKEERKGFTMSNINDTIARINELAAKKKSGQELTTEELAEKKELYATYLGFIRGQVKQQLDRIEFVDPEPVEKTIITEGKDDTIVAEESANHHH